MSLMQFLLRPWRGNKTPQKAAKHSRGFTTDYYWSMNDEYMHRLWARKSAEQIIKDHHEITEQETQTMNREEYLKAAADACIPTQNEIYGELDYVMTGLKKAAKDGCSLPLVIPLTWRGRSVYSPESGRHSSTVTASPGSALRKKRSAIACGVAEALEGLGYTVTIDHTNIDIITVE